MEQEAASNKAWEPKGLGSSKNNKSLPINPSVTRTSLPLQATSHHHQGTSKLCESINHESQGGEQGPAGGQKVGYGGEEEDEEEGWFR